MCVGIVRLDGLPPLSLVNSAGKVRSCSLQAGVNNAAS